ncbi:MAG TPA: coenzyme F420-0:L-glutamate ligase [Candidatus Binataceae bacterium]|nr:coenzyme F420-0:L-glutamate ligase [Candidatus Binataceae bacterium]
MASITLTAIEGVPIVKSGDDLAALIAKGLDQTRLTLQNGDIVLVCQKIISKAEGRMVDLKTIVPSPFAKQYAARWEKDPRAVELVLRQTNRIVRNDRGVLIVETGPGFVCANAGVDESNTLGDDLALLLPEDSDASARKIRDGLKRLCGADAAVLVTDTFGRPWRDGLTDICIGVAGINPILDLRGTNDLGGRELHHTVVALADQLSAAAGLLMEKASGIPAVLVRGYKFEPYEGTAKILIRPAEADLFR